MSCRGASSRKVVDGGWTSLARPPCAWGQGTGVRRECGRRLGMGTEHRQESPCRLPFLLLAQLPVALNVSRTALLHTICTEPGPPAVSYDRPFTATSTDSSCSYRGLTYSPGSDEYTLGSESSQGVYTQLEGGHYLTRDLLLHLVTSTAVIDPHQPALGPSLRA